MVSTAILAAKAMLAGPRCIDAPPCRSRIATATSSTRRPRRTARTSTLASATSSG